jgi:YidC/Oxa1 family membrane protein insertase
LNDYPSGLTYYYFLSLLITILLTIAFRYLIDEDKVLARLEANKAKPKKKSGFMARLEEAQRIQQRQMREKNKTNSTKRRR